MAAQMEVGIGLPATIPGTRSQDLLAWARAADEGAFSSLGVLDRLVWDNYEPLVALTAAAAVTSRIRLATTVLVAPYRADVAVLAKQLASLDHLSEGRLVVGMAAGYRADDYLANGTAHRDRGARLDAAIERMQQIWAGKAGSDDAGPIGPTPDRPPRLMFGGHSAPAARRCARHGWGWIAGGSSPHGYQANLERVRQIWAAEGRTAEPHKTALCYFALGPDADRHTRSFLADYYAFLGPQYAARVAGGALIDGPMIRDTMQAYRAAGCDELLLMPCATDPRQVDLLAEAVWG